jgi:carboxyl-terminal processing protease
MSLGRERALLVLAAGSTAALAALTALALAGRLGPRRAESAPGEALYREAVSRVLKDFVVPPDEERLVYGAVKGILAELDDPYAKALPPAEWEAFKRESRGEQTGVGWETAVVGDEVVVAFLVPDGPAERAGLRAGDRVLALDGKPVDAARGADAVERAARGAPGTGLTVRVSARGGGDVRETTLRRAVYDAPQIHGRLVDAALGLGVVRVASFKTGGEEAFRRAVETLRAQGLKGLVVDLRFDRGGSFEAAVAVADLWMSEGAVCRTRGANRGETFSATAEAPLAGLPTVVLVNGSTASAAEVLAGALQDVHAAVLVGEPTYGKGVVQEVIPFATWAGGMKLTVARYYTPADRCVEARLLGPGEKGAGRIRPDVAVPLTDAERERLRREAARFHWDARVRDEAAAFAAGATSRPGRFVDRQLDAALALVSGRPYDGGPPEDD